MRFQELSLYTHQLAEQKLFYHRTLGLSLVDKMAISFTVQAGMTRLRFQEVQQEVLYHLAFTIPRNTFAQAKSWLSERAPLLYKGDRDAIFFANINARSFYFCDAANNILEFIVHYALDQETEGAFGPADILHVSEIGLPVENVPAHAALLQKALGIQPYGGQVSDDFAFLGDIYGQLVVVRTGRPWLPTETVLAAPAPLQLTISGQREQHVDLSPLPYSITVRP